MSNDMFEMDKPSKPQGNGYGRKQREAHAYSNIYVPTEKGRGKIGFIRWEEGNEAHADVINAYASVAEMSDGAAKDQAVNDISATIVSMITIDYQLANQIKAKFEGISKLGAIVDAAKKVAMRDEFLKQEIPVQEPEVVQETAEDDMPF